MDNNNITESDFAWYGWLASAVGMLGFMMMVVGAGKFSGSEDMEWWVLLGCATVSLGFCLFKVYELRFMCDLQRGWLEMRVYKPVIRIGLAMIAVTFVLQLPDVVQFAEDGKWLLVVGNVGVIAYACLKISQDYHSYKWPLAFWAGFILVFDYL